MNEQNVHVSANAKGIYAPKTIKVKFPTETKGLKIKQLEDAMSRLMSAGRVVQEAVGPASRAKFRLVEAQS